MQASYIVPEYEYLVPSDVDIRTRLLRHVVSGEDDGQRTEGGGEQARGTFPSGFPRLSEKIDMP